MISLFSHDQLESISEKVIKEADNAGSGYITFEEFFEAIKELDISGKMAFVSFSGPPRKHVDERPYFDRYYGHSISNVTNQTDLSVATLKTIDE